DVPYAIEAQLRYVTEPRMDYRQRLYGAHAPAALRNVARWLRVDEWLGDAPAEAQTHTLILVDGEPFTRLGAAALPLRDGGPLAARAVLRCAPSLSLAAEWCAAPRAAVRTGEALF
ncbi:MAG: hypothetical protein M1546_24420, partial [Chloroflexi bacterium]|nr:hypothetical protein [Chloroflexota bacterium]